MDTFVAGREGLRMVHTVIIRCSVFAHGSGLGVRCSKGSGWSDRAGFDVGGVTTDERLLLEVGDVGASRCASNIMTRSVI